ncbi:flagellar hook-associated family protein [Acuticoccus sp.]|uniref:flagellar hook-associated family protein n=1 Tax=Acuticoccus sp. TaxID=1904378 RepID=UPI003B519786
MHASYISTAALRDAPRSQITRLQTELTDRTKEVATQRHADVGLALGSATGHTVSSRIDLALVETLITSNASAAARLSMTQSALADLETVASEMMSALVALPPGNASARTLTIQAQSSLDRFADRLNASDGGSYLFGGQRTQQPPMRRFDDGARTSIDLQFQAKFGMSAYDPAVATIDPSDMRDFLQNEFAGEFDLTGWDIAWSSASSGNMQSRIAPSEWLETGTNANEQAIRTLAQGFSMVAALNLSGLSESVREVVVEEARLVVGRAITEVVALKAKLGFAENAVDKADSRLRLSRDILTTKIAELEGADPVEAKVRIDLLTTQLEMSYALTNQLSRLSILNYA